jgi:hypothetical protein
MTGTGSWINWSPLKPVDVGPLSCAGISSFRTNLSGNSHAISNSIGTRLSPRTCRVRPVATKFLTGENGRGILRCGRWGLRTDRHRARQNGHNTADRKDMCENAHRSPVYRRV